jgi:hypothetical protein
MVTATARTPVFVLCAALALAGVSACRRQAEPQPFAALLGERARKPPPSSDGACRFDMSGDKADSVFFVLGFVDEYLGRRFVEDDDRVERFYPNEMDKAAVFERQLAKLASEQGLEPAVRSPEGQQGHIAFRSKPIADRLNSCYKYQASGGEVGPGPDGTYRRLASASLGRSLFMRAGHGSSRGNGLPDEVFHRRRALAYLAGAWCRYGRGNEFIFANSSDKAELIAQLLDDVGCRDVRREYNFGYIPRTNWVRFQPTDELKAWLDRSW